MNNKDVQNEENECQITLIGASQSGKTTLAAGLAKASDANFTVGFADNRTRDYLEPRIAGIESGVWPEATNMENLDLVLNLNTAGGRRATIAFKEYMGEKIRDNTYITNVVGTPKGALILLSPGMSILRDPAMRNEMIGNLKGIIDHLKGNGCIAISFVVTACDRLETDLKDFAPKFEDYAAEITNYLQTSGIKWKRFNVTITGKLASQSEPSIASGEKNTSREPFQWIMKQVVRKGTISTIQKVSRIVAIVLVSLASLYMAYRGYLYFSEKNALAKWEKEVTTRSNKLKEYKTIAELNNGTAELRKILDSGVSTLRFESNIYRKKSIFTKWSLVCDKERMRYFTMEMDAKENDKENSGDKIICEEFGKKLSEFNPEDSTLKSNLITRWNVLCPQLLQAYDAKTNRELKLELANFAKEAAMKADEKTVHKKRQKIEEWAPGTDSGKKLKDELLVYFNAESVKWRTAFENRVCREDAEVIIKKIDSLRNDSTRTEIRGPYTDIINFENKHTKADATTLKTTKQNIVARYEKFLEKYLNSFCIWKKEDRKVPSISNETREWIQNVLDFEDLLTPGKKCSERFLANLEIHRANAEIKWREYQLKLCNDFIANEFTQGRDIVECYRKYQEWYEDNADNVSVDVVNDKVSSFIGAWIREYVFAWKKQFIDDSGNNNVWSNDINNYCSKSIDTKRYSDLRSLCLRMSKDPCGIANTSCAAFANRCKEREIEKGIYASFPQSLHIKNVYAKVKFDSIENNGFLEIDANANSKIWDSNAKCVCNIGSATISIESRVRKSQSENWIHLFSGDIVIQTNPWMCMLVSIPWRENATTLGFGEKNGTISWILPHNLDSSPFQGSMIYAECIKNTFHTDTIFKVEIWVEGYIEGDDVYTIYNECFSEKGK